jgi:hypothetical protein
MPSVLFVVSAGNSGYNLDTNNQLPAVLTKSLPNVISVAGVAPSLKSPHSGSLPTISHQTLDQRCKFTKGSSNWGTLTEVGIPGKGTIDLAAPGITYVIGPKTDGLGRITGTSFSAPIVAGTAAILYMLKNYSGELAHCNTNCMPGKIKRILRETADDISQNWDKNRMRRLNVLAAVTRVLPPPNRANLYIADQEANQIYSLPFETLTGRLNVDPADDSKITDAQVVMKPPGVGDEISPTSLIASSDGLHVFSVIKATTGNAIATINTRSGRITNIIPFSKYLKNSTETSMLEQSKDGRLVFVIAQSRTLVFDTYTKQFLGPSLPSQPKTSLEPGNGAQFVNAQVSEDGKRLYVVRNAGDGYGNQPGDVLAYDIDLTRDKLPEKTGLHPVTDDYFGFQEQFVLPSGDSPKAVAISPDDKQVYIVHGGFYRFVNSKLDEFELSEVLKDLLTFRYSQMVDDAFKTLYVWALRQGVIDIQAPGWTGVFDATTGIRKDDFNSMLTYGWGHRASPVIPTNAIYSRRPFDIAIRPHDGKRALVPFYQTANFGVLDLDEQKRFRDPPVSSMNYQGLVAVTSNPGLDNYAWPIKPKDVALMFPTHVEYAQNGRFAGAIHKGSQGHSECHQKEESESSDPIPPSCEDAKVQRGSISIIDDGAITKDFDSPEMEKDYNFVPLDARVVHSYKRILFKTGVEKAFLRPRGIAIQPILSLLTPKHGDIMWRTAPIHVQWHTPENSQPVVSRVQFKIEEFDSDGDVIKTLPEKGYPVDWTIENPVDAFSFARKEIKISIQELLTNPGADKKVGTPDDVRLTITTNPGRDGVLGTRDDILPRLTVTAYDNANPRNEVSRVSVRIHFREGG